MSSKYRNHGSVSFTALLVVAVSVVGITLAIYHFPRDGASDRATRGVKTMGESVSPVSLVGNSENESSENLLSSFSESQHASVENRSTSEESKRQQNFVDDNSPFEQWLQENFSTEQNTIDSFGNSSELTAGSDGDVVLTDVVTHDPSIDAVDRQDNFGGYLSIRGRIRSTAGQPIGGHTLIAERRIDNKRMFRSTVSDSNGSFSIEGLTAGDYLLRAQDSPLYAERTMRVRAGTDPVNLILSAHGYATVSGIVKDSVGAPIAGVSIIPTILDEQVSTDEEGRFNFEVSALDGQGLLLRYQAEGYLSETRYFEPERWALDNKLQADMQLRSSGRLSLTGTVLNEQGYPIEKALVQIRSRESQFYESTVADNDGQYSIEGMLPADDYTLRISSSVQYEAYVTSNMRINSDIAGMHVTLPYAPMGRMSGTIVDSLGTPVPQVSLLALSSGVSGRTTTIVSNDLGEFVLAGFVAGELTLRSHSPPNIAVQGVSLNPDEDTSLTVVVDMGEYSLSGVVTDSQGLFVPEASITMKSIHNENGLNSSTTRSVKSDSTGSFEFTGLGAGERSIIVVAENHATEKVSVDPALDSGPYLITLQR